MIVWLRVCCKRVAVAVVVIKIQSFEVKFTPFRRSIGSRTPADS